MEHRDLICIGCPLGCPLTVTIENGEVTEVKGNTCPKGDAYARKEVTNPTRIVTSTVVVEGGVAPMAKTTRSAHTSTTNSLANANVLLWLQVKWNRLSLPKQNLLNTQTLTESLLH